MFGVVFWVVWCCGCVYGFLGCVLGVGGILLGCAGLRRVLACFQVLWVVFGCWWCGGMFSGVGVWCVVGVHHAGVTYSCLCIYIDITH